jgi:hypothetical protein
VTSSHDVPARSNLTSVQRQPARWTFNLDQGSRSTHACRTRSVAFATKCRSCQRLVLSWRAAMTYDDRWPRAWRRRNPSRKKRLLCYDEHRSATELSGHRQSALFSCVATKFTDVALSDFVRGFVSLNQFTTSPLIWRDRSPVAALARPFGSGHLPRADVCRPRTAL